MIALACPMTDAAGQPGGVGVELCGGARLLQRRQAGGELFGEVDLDLADVRLGARGAPGTVSFAVRLAPFALLVLPAGRDLESRV